ncbi:MAG: hypothetical protein C5B54_01625 [Acidobacteria bacterium]|nr:MAG: hypothetical protein C5B54_01625 [Acidobacteriota bacterium]
MDKKLLIFLTVFFAFFFIYQKFVLEPAAKKSQPQPTSSASAPNEPAQSAPAPQTTQSAVSLTPPPAEATQIQAANERKIEVDTSLYHAVFTNKGAVLTSFRLKKYTDDFSQPLEMIPQLPPGANGLPLGFDFEDKRINGVADSAIFDVNQDNLKIADSQRDHLQFVYSKDGYTFKKELEFIGGSYLMECKFEAYSNNNALPLRLSWTPGLESLGGYKDTLQVKPSGAVVNLGDKVERIASKSVKEFKKVGATVKWAGVENNYFAGIFIPENQPSDAFVNTPPATEKSDVHNVNLLLQPQASAPMQVRMFIGPKDYVLLQHIGYELEDSVDFGRFAPITKALFFTLKVFYGWVHNWGWAIVILTAVIKVVFTPLTQKSFSSMKKMQVMQPEMKKIQDKYSKMKDDDPRKSNMNMEILALQKRYGVNPLSGCLPMLVQMPVLYAFWALLTNVIELRKAPFMFWLQDLSRPDPYHVVPVAMGGIMLLQQRMTPSTDPMQKNMMYIMPVMFTFISLKLQSGLVLYWLFSNLLAILHQYYFQYTQKVAEAKVANA